MAAKQSGRDIIPRVENIINLKTLCEEISRFDLVLLERRITKNKRHKR